MISLVCIVTGLLLSLGGALLTVELPIKAMLIDASRWGGCPPDKIEFYDKQIRRNATVARILLVIGTALQIYGSLKS